MPKLPEGWTFQYLGVGVFPTSKEYLVLRSGAPQFEISVDRPGTGARILIGAHIKYIWRREIEDFTKLWKPLES